MISTGVHLHECSCTWMCNTEPPHVPVSRRSLCASLRPHLPPPPPQPPNSRSRWGKEQNAHRFYRPFASNLTAALLFRCVCPGLRCAGADWPEPSFVVIAEKPDAAAAAARKVQASAGAGGEEENVRFGTINGVSGGAVESVAVPFAPFEQSLVGVDSVGNDVLSQALGSKLDFEETSTYVIYGAGAFLAGWILSAVVSAIDSIPLLPKILEIVGFGYTIWFSTRYLIYKENRDELLVKVEDLKRRIIGSGDA